MASIGVPLKIIEILIQKSNLKMHFVDNDAFYPLGIKTGKFYWQLMSGFDTFDSFEAPQWWCVLCKEKHHAAQPPFLDMSTVLWQKSPEWQIRFE